MTRAKVEIHQCLFFLICVICLPLPRMYNIRHIAENGGWRRAGAALRFKKWSRRRGLEMTSVDEHIEGIRGRGEDRESHGCARPAPPGPHLVLDRG